MLFHGVAAVAIVGGDGERRRARVVAARDPLERVDLRRVVGEDGLSPCCLHALIIDRTRWAAVPLFSDGGTRKPCGSLTNSTQQGRTLPGMRIAVAAAVTAVAVTVVALVVAASVGAARKPVHVEPDVFAGLGTWIDIYDGGLLKQPELLADRLAARGVRTVYVETANYKAAEDVVNARQVGRFLDRLHVLGLKAVAWYLPGFLQPVKDSRRALAMLAFRGPAGSAFDGVALDIEALVLKNVQRRTDRTLELLGQLRAAAGAVPVAAITYPPRMLERHLSWWPRFPWAEIAAQVDAVIPMAYTGSSFPGYDATYGYVARSLALLRAAVGPDVALHVAGGVADRMTAEELKAFADAVADNGTAVGWSLYDLATTTAAGWKALAPLSSPTSASPVGAGSP